MSTIQTKSGKFVIIDSAKKEDAKEIISYFKKVGSESDFLSFGFEGYGSNVEKEEEYIQRFRAAPTSKMIKGVIDDKIVAIATLSADPESRFSHNAEIGVSVLKDYWDDGIGGAMVDELLFFARTTRHIRNVYLNVIAENTRAIALYKKFGFTECGYFKNYSKVGQKFYDKIIMVLEI